MVSLDVCPDGGGVRLFIKLMKKMPELMKVVSNKMTVTVFVAIH